MSRTIVRRYVMCLINKFTKLIQWRKPLNMLSNLLSKCYLPRLCLRSLALLTSRGQEGMPSPILNTAQRCMI